MSLLLPQEAEALLEMFEGGEVTLNPVHEMDGSVKRHQLWPAKTCTHNGGEELARVLDLNLGTWANQTGEQRPATLEAIHTWVRARVSGSEERATK